MVETNTVTVEPMSDHLDDNEHVFTLPGISQYSLGSSSGCGLAALNAIKVLFSRQARGSRGQELLNLVSQRNILEECMSICAGFENQAHMELEDISTLPLFKASSRLVATDYGTPSLRFFDSLLQRLGKLSADPRNGCSAVVITRPPEILVCFHIPQPVGEAYVVFDSHPRQKHPFGAAFICNVSRSRTADYLSELFRMDPELLSESPNLQWQAQLLGHVSGDFFIPTGTDLLLSRDAANVMAESNLAVLALKMQAKEVSSQNLRLARENEALVNQIAEMRERGPRGSRDHRPKSTYENRRTTYPFPEHDPRLFPIIEEDAPAVQQSRFGPSKPGVEGRVSDHPQLYKDNPRQGEAEEYCRSPEVVDAIDTSGQSSKTTSSTAQGSSAAEASKGGFFASLFGFVQPDNETDYSSGSPELPGSLFLEDPSDSPVLLTTPGRSGDSGPVKDSVGNKGKQRATHPDHYLQPYQVIDSASGVHPEQYDEYLARREQWTELAKLQDDFDREDTELRNQLSDVRLYWDSQDNENSWQDDISPASAELQHPVDVQDTRNRDAGRLSEAVSTTFDCGICMDVFSTDFVAMVDGCGHEFCRECLRRYACGKIRERCLPIPCPLCTATSSSSRLTRGSEHPVGGTVIEDALVQQLGVPEEEYEIFVQLQMTSHSVQIECRKCRIGFFAWREDFNTTQFLSCPMPGCYHVWCKHCQQPLDPEGPEHSCDGVNEFNDLVSKKGWKICPGCKSPTEKISGCNHMTCKAPGCRTEFCYRCGATMKACRCPP